MVVVAVNEKKTAKTSWDASNEIICDDTGVSYLQIFKERFNW
jgi:hypothetical protein